MGYRISPCRIIRISVAEKKIYIYKTFPISRIQGKMYVAFYRRDPRIKMHNVIQTAHAHSGGETTKNNTQLLLYLQQ